MIETEIEKGRERRKRERGLEKKRVRSDRENERQSKGWHSERLTAALPSAMQNREPRRRVLERRLGLTDESTGTGTGAGWERQTKRSRKNARQTDRQ